MQTNKKPYSIEATVRELVITIILRSDEIVNEDGYDPRVVIPFALSLSSRSATQHTVYDDETTALTRALVDRLNFDVRKDKDLDSKLFNFEYDLVKEDKTLQGKVKFELMKDNDIYKVTSVMVLYCKETIMSFLKQLVKNTEFLLTDCEINIHDYIDCTFNGDECDIYYIIKQYHGAQ